ncbi:MAG: hypothetical protein CME13_19925 [Gemmatimonadetes bacterium]|jgi:hypothetical protein|nr:hypothetical protein [Gemmatimonadota bacterium]
MESEVFGHEAGAFTYARQRKQGLIELGAGGTVLLDEISLLVPVSCCYQPLVTAARKGESLTLTRHPTECPVVDNRVSLTTERSHGGNHSRESQTRITPQ